MRFDRLLTRKQFILGFLGGAAVPALGRLGAADENTADEKDKKPAEAATPLSLEDVRAWERLAGLEFTEDERREILDEARGLRADFVRLRAVPIELFTPPPTPFVPEGRQPPAAKELKVELAERSGLERPAQDEDLAFLTIPELRALLRGRKLSPLDLAKVCLERLKRYGEKLLCVVTLTEELALRQAKRAEEEIAAGMDRGPLHGIPYGSKDLFALPGHPTTFGAAPYREQVLPFTAAAIEKLEGAGAVHCAKLSLGALAMDDVWFRGKTRNPWNPEEGSSGSSAGSASAVAAGLLPFALGTETQGSIVSPAHRCRVSGLRSTFGRVSRFGAMPLSWSMDKVGALARTSEDCALALAAILGSDPRDLAAVDRPFRYPAAPDLKGLKVGFLDLSSPEAKALDGEESAAGVLEEAKAILNELGAQLAPVRFTPLPGGVGVDLEVESAAVFDELTRNGRIREVQNSLWPRIFRAHRFVPAVEYLQALRARSLVMRRFEEELGSFDLVLVPGRGSYTLYLTNRTGHPQLLVPFGTSPNGQARSLSLIGRLYGEDLLCQVGWSLEQRLGHYRKRPDLTAR